MPRVWCEIPVPTGYRSLPPVGALFREMLSQYVSNSLLSFNNNRLVLITFPNEVSGEANPRKVIQFFSRRGFTTCDMNLPGV